MLWRVGLSFVKDPNSSEPYGLNWTRYLLELGSGVTISATTWAVTPSGLALSGASIVTGNLQTQVRASGGTDGQDYTVTNHITCSDGTEDDRSFVIHVRQR